MRTIIARNAHQALAESAFQLHHFGATDECGGKVLPIPTSTLITNSSERVAFYAGLNPFNALLTAARNMAEVRTEHVVDAGKALKNRPDARVTMTGEQCDPLGVIYAQVDLDGKIQVMGCSSETNVIHEADDLVYLSMVQAYIARASGREPGVLWHTSMSPSCEVSQLDLLSDVADQAPTPPAQFNDPYSSGTVTDTIPLLSIPAGRWFRELVQFFVSERYDSVDYVDPFIQHVLAPAHRAEQLYLESAPLDAVQRAIGEIAAQDWMQACLQWVNANTKSEIS
tara:strand:- start:35 stop:883 length:849 start_codon:yes stop_codon:yes gene_type:complete